MSGWHATRFIALCWIFSLKIFAICGEINLIDVSLSYYTHNLMQSFTKIIQLG